MITVKATKAGFLDKIREPGEVFEIANKKQFSENWMERYVPLKQEAAEGDETSEPNGNGDEDGQTGDGQAGGGETGAG